ncbi:MAG: ribbon-helix-helix domain-containing protein [Defluviitaleaceae bacterium]|nr:ribbon-helix-helix domain-containing protein [Defluviitaleaceae bacterium]
MDGFKPIKNEKTVISIRIDRDMLTVIDELANDTDISRNEMIIQCIDYALKNSKEKQAV